MWLLSLCVSVELTIEHSAPLRFPMVENEGTGGGMRMGKRIRNIDGREGWDTH